MSGVTDALVEAAGEAVNAATTESLFETELGYLHGAEPVPQFLF